MTVWRAALLGDVQTILAMGDHVNDGDRGTYPMHLAACAGQLGALVALSSLGADVDVVDANGETPLMLAMQHSNPDTVATLMRLGADGNKADRHGVSPLQLAERGEPTTELVRALCDAQEDVCSVKQPGPTWSPRVVSTSVSGQDRSMQRRGTKARNVGETMKRLHQTRLQLAEHTMRSSLTEGASSLFSPTQRSMMSCTSKSTTRPPTARRPKKPDNPDSWLENHEASATLMIKNLGIDETRDSDDLSTLGGDATPPSNPEPPKPGSRPSSRRPSLVEPVESARRPSFVTREENTIRLQEWEDTFQSLKEALGV